MTLSLQPVELGGRRRRFSRATLERFPLTQPEWRCQRCGSAGDGPLELDHMVELVHQGIDHPYNLIRLCTRCHRAKPFLEGNLSAMERRLAIITWAHSSVLLRWEEPDERAWRKLTMAMMVGRR